VREDADVQNVDVLFSSFNTSINYQYPSINSPALGSRNLTYRAGKAWGWDKYCEWYVGSVR
jgi:choline dehydrogenase